MKSVIASIAKLVYLLTAEGKPLPRIPDKEVKPKEELDIVEIIQLVFLIQAALSILSFFAAIIFAIFSIDTPNINVALKCLGGSGVWLFLNSFIVQFIIL